MASNEEILSIPDIMTRYGVSVHLVRSYIAAGHLRGWRNGDGRKARWNFPASLCERVFARYLGAMTAEDVGQLANITSSGVLQAAKKGSLVGFRAPAHQGQRSAKQYFERKEVERWMASRSRGRKRTAAAQAQAPANGLAPELKDVPLPLTTTEAPKVEARPMAAEQGAEVVKAIRWLADATATLAEAEQSQTNAIVLLRGDMLVLTHSVTALAKWVEELSKPSGK